MILDHKDIANGFFSQSLLSTGLENELTPEANTHSIIGNFDESARDYYRVEGDKYLLKLIYRYTSDPDDELIWKQSSWITEQTITGADLFGIPMETPGLDPNFDFHGLGVSNHFLATIHIWMVMDMKVISGMFIYMCSFARNMF